MSKPMISTKNSGMICDSPRICTILRVYSITLSCPDQYVGRTMCHGKLSAWELKGIPVVKIKLLLQSLSSDVHNHLYISC